MSLLSRIAGRLFGRRETDALPVGAGCVADADLGTPVSETEGGRLWTTLARMRICPDCGAPVEEVEDGPQGGISTNIRLHPCGHWFNATPMLGTMERIRR